MKRKILKILWSSDCRLWSIKGNRKGYWLPFLGHKRQWEGGVGCRLWGIKGNGKGYCLPFMEHKRQSEGVLFAVVGKKEAIDEAMFAIIVG